MKQAVIAGYARTPFHFARKGGLIGEIGRAHV